MNIILAATVTQTGASLGRGLIIYWEHGLKTTIWINSVFP
jgi:hypothetical protein